MKREIGVQPHLPFFVSNYKSTEVIAKRNEEAGMQGSSERESEAYTEVRRAF
jgi:hypothetical protein